MQVLALNGGSSSLKFGLFKTEAASAIQLVSGAVEHSTPDGRLFDAIDDAMRDLRPEAIGHRIVHGGPDLFKPTRIDADVLAGLEKACAFAPLHGPASLELIARAQSRYPDLPQVACFDTGFHAELPPIAAMLPLPAALRAAGVRRYGFHGLSCQSILRQLGGDVPARLIIAHLGSGASVTAVLDGKSVDTSMGLTPTGGVVMATRTGDLDPGVLLYLIRDQGIDAAVLEALVDRRSGLLGISSLSGDLRQLHDAAPSRPEAGLAITIFCRSIAKAIAGMMVALGGADLIVLTGGVGENDASVREAVLRDLTWAGPLAVRTMPSLENEEIARATRGVLSSS